MRKKMDTPIQIVKEFIESELYQKEKEKFSNEIKQTGICEIPLFVGKNTEINTLISEMNLFQDHKIRAQGHTTAYNASVDTKYGADHPRNLKQKTGMWVIPNDAIIEESVINKLYRSQEMLQLMKEIIGTQHVYRFEDSYVSININMMGPGDNFLWHFDQCQYVAVIVLNKPKSGGILEIHGLTRDQSNDNYDVVEKVISGEITENVKSITPEVGMLYIMKGHKCLHRVTEVSSGNRNAIVYSFDDINDRDAKESIVEFVTSHPKNRQKEI